MTRQFFKQMPMPAANRTRGLIAVPSCAKSALRLLGVLGLLSAVTACNSASDANHPLRGGASAVGWATTVGEPKDFVKASRGTTELAYVPVGRRGIERPVQVRTALAVQSLEGELDRTRDTSERFARRTLPGGAYGQPLRSVARPAVAQRLGVSQPSVGSPGSFPVNPSRLRQIRENARQATDPQ
jgi:hypothetical protein